MIKDNILENYFLRYVILILHEFTEEHAKDKFF